MLPSPAATGDVTDARALTAEHGQITQCFQTKFEGAQADVEVAI